MCSSRRERPPPDAHGIPTEMPSGLKRPSHGERPSAARGRTSVHIGKSPLPWGRAEKHDIVIRTRCKIPFSGTVFDSRSLRSRETT